MTEFSDYVVYADESGDHGLVSIDPQFPVFALVFCIMRKADYTASVVPAFQHFKFSIWGHDAVVLHEHDIRMCKGPFAILLTDRDLRERFYASLNCLVEAAPMTICAAVVDKRKLLTRCSDIRHPYRDALHFCMEQLHKVLSDERQHGRTVHVIFEGRGKKEDRDLELEFRRIAASKGRTGYGRQDFGVFDFQPVFVPKSANSVGLQLADLTARPIALSYLRPKQPNRAYEIVQPKLRGLGHLP